MPRRLARSASWHATGPPERRTKPWPPWAGSPRPRRSRSFNRRSPPARRRPAPPRPMPCWPPPSRSWPPANGTRPRRFTTASDAQTCRNLCGQRRPMTRFLPDRRTACRCSSSSSRPTTPRCSPWHSAPPAACRAVNGRGRCWRNWTICRRRAGSWSLPRWKIAATERSRPPCSRRRPAARRKCGWPQSACWGEPATPPRRRCCWTPRSGPTRPWPRRHRRA